MALKSLSITRTEYGVDDKVEYRYVAVYDEDTYAGFITLSQEQLDASTSRGLCVATQCVAQVAAQLARQHHPVSGLAGTTRSGWPPLPHAVPYRMPPFKRTELTA